MWVMPVTTNAQHDVPALIAPWLAQHPGVTVRVTVLDWESGWNKITAAAASRRGPDLLELGTTWMPAIAAMGGLEQLSAGAAGRGRQRRAVLPRAVEDDAGVRPARRLRPALVRRRARRVLPHRRVPPGRRRPEAGVRRLGLVPCGAEEDQRHRWSAGKRVAALAYAGKNDWNVVHNLAPWIWNAGGDVLSADAKHSALDSPQALRAIDFYSSLAVEGLVPSNALEKDSDILEGAWVGGDYGVIFSGPWLMRRIFESPAGLGRAIATSTSRRIPPGRTATRRSSAARTSRSSRARATRPRPGSW